MKILRLCLVLTLLLTLLFFNARSQSTQLEIDGVQRLNITDLKFEVNTPNSAADTLMVFRMTHSNDSNHLAFMNGTGIGTNFVPVILGSNQNNSIGLYHIASISSNTSSQPGMLFDTRLPTGPVINRPLFRWQTYGQSKMIMMADGNLGIGVTTPSARLHMSGGAFLIDGPFGATPVSGAGERMMWIPSKAAFRAGEINGGQWDAGNIGTRSFVGGGFNNIASGGTSFIGGGESNTVSGASGFIAGGLTNSVIGSMGFVGGGQLNTSTASRSFVGGGYDNTASGIGSFIGGGKENIAGGQESSIGGGWGNNASANSTFIGGGYTNMANGAGSFIGGGQSNTTTGWLTFAGGGHGLNAPGLSQAVFGQFNSNVAADPDSWVTSDPLFVIGNGTSNVARSNAITVLKNGNVGIGTSSPSASLHVAGAIKLSPIGFGKIQMTDQLDDGLAAKDDLILSALGGILMQLDQGNNGISGSNHFAIFDDSTHLFEVRQNGDVGIGTSSPSTKLDVVGGAKVDGNTFNVIASSNRVGIGTASPTTDLHVVGGARIESGATIEGNVWITDGSELRIWNAGNLQDWKMHVPSADPDLVFSHNGAPKAYVELITGSWNTLSDERFKKNIVPVSSVLEDVLELTPKTYHFKEQDDADERSYGFIAQEVIEIFPEAASYSESRDQYMVNYDVFSVLAIKAIQEQQEMIDQLTSVLASNEQDMSTMEAKLSSLESRMKKLESVITQGVASN